MGIRTGWLLGLLVLGETVTSAHGHVLPRPLKLVQLNKQLCGRVVCHTANHGPDRRIWSEALKERRDLYVYLPPGYDPCQRYPLGIVLHGFLSDELSFLDDVVKPFDQAMATGKLPRMILAAPDGSPRGMDCITVTGTFFLNSKLGAFEDFLVHDVYGFLLRNYPIRPEAEAHALLGVSMGGSAAFNKVMKFRDKFGVATAFAPPLNLRWISCRGCYFDNFDPCCWSWRTDFSHGRSVVGIFGNGLLKIRLWQLLYPLYGKHNPRLAELVAHDSPIEMLERLNICPGFAEFYVAYGGRDEFNIDAQVESFLYRAKQRGLVISVDYDPTGKHDVDTAQKMLPKMIEWLGERMRPYSSDCR